ncbi:MAG: hydrogenase accessory protein HypB, partial [Oscillospiraceae bacterium]|nr:hydrogenase accessory protein HypB [Oscillospiraceae bacterium]
MGEVKVIQVNESIFAENDRQSLLVREKLSGQGTLFLNFMSSPGSGKTTTLVSVINRLKEKYSIAEMDVDIASTLDAQRVADRTGVCSMQIHNGGLCHIDADMTARALEEFDTAGLDLLILENIGNLVCPAEF